VKTSEIASIRLQSQQISVHDFKKPEDIVAWMGAMQAQDFAMAKWAVGLRLKNSTEQQVQEAIDDGKIIRTHALRPTWHFVTPENIYWMLEISAPQIKTQMRSRDKQLGLSEKIYSKSNSIIEKALLKNKFLDRDEIVKELSKAKIATDEYRSGHLLLRAELDGIVCSGPTKNKKQTYALLSERVPHYKKLAREEALAKLAQSYFSSHGPATLKDFAWWSGLRMKDVNDAVNPVKKNFIAENVDGETYYFNDSFSKIKKNNTIFLLPAYDEFLISYKNRNASLLLEHKQHALSQNGIFRPVIVINGQAAGIWKRTFSKDKVIIEPDFFRNIKPAKDSLKKEAQQFGDFLGKKVEVAF
jgi:hypothetical protein